MEIKIHLYDAGHMTKMATLSIHGKNKNIKMSSFKSSETFQRKRVGQTDLFRIKPFKNLPLGNRQTDFHETWYVASETPSNYSLFK